MSLVVLDDHLLRDLIVGEVAPALAAVIDEHQPVTTNLYLYRLCRSALAARGGQVTGRLPATTRQALGRALAGEADDLDIVPLRRLAVRMAELSAAHRLPTLGAEAVAAAEHLDATLCVWSGDDGPTIGAAAAAVGVRYVTIAR